MTSSAIPAPALRGPVRSDALAGKVALVTGASRGLGRGMALGLAAAGAHVVAVARGLPGLRETCDLVAAAGGRATAAGCDVTDEDSVARMDVTVAEDVGGVDVLVNNAGVAWERPFAELSMAELRSTLEVNVVGPFLLSRVIGARMRERGGGKIVNIGSIDAVVGVPNLAHYCASKGAVAQLTRALAVEWAKYGITVNCLCPGYFPTDINAEALQDTQVRDKVLRRIPLRRFGTLGDLVPWVVFLSTPASDYMTGQIVLLDGGESAR